MFALTQVLAAAGLAAVTMAFGTVTGPPQVTELRSLEPVASQADLAPATLRPDPTYVDQPFEGWGTSLVWFANATGNYPLEIRGRSRTKPRDSHRVGDENVHNPGCADTTTLSA